MPSRHLDNDLPAPAARRATTGQELTALAVKLAQRLDELADDAEHHRTAYVLAREAIDRAAAAVDDLRDAERATPPRAAPRKQLRRRA